MQERASDLERAVQLLSWDNASTVEWALSYIHQLARHGAASRNGGQRFGVQLLDEIGASATLVPALVALLQLAAPAGSARARWPAECRRR